MLLRSRQIQAQMFGIFFSLFSNSIHNFSIYYLKYKKKIWIFFALWIDTYRLECMFVYLFEIVMKEEKKPNNKRANEFIL